MPAHVRALPRIGTTAIVTVALAWIAYRGGFYGIQQRAGLAVVAWVLAGACIGLGLWNMGQSTTATKVMAVGFGGFAVVTFVSAVTTADAGAAVERGDLILAYFGVFLVVTLTLRWIRVEAWLDAVALTVGIVSVLALVSRLFPGTLSSTDLGRYLPGTSSRLSYPVNYWNALAVLLALGLPCWLRLAASARSSFVRGAAVAPIPVLAAVFYLTSSRGGVAAAALAAVVFVLASGRAWSAVWALSVGIAGSVIVVHSLRARPAIVNGPFTTTLAAQQGHRVAEVVLLAAFVVGIVSGVGFAMGRGRIRVPRAADIAALGAAVIAVGVLIAVSHPMRRLHQFKTPADVLAAHDPAQATVGGHLVTFSGSGRWQLWQSAVDEWKTAPVLGRGAGSFTWWWSEHATLPHFVRDAHSIYLQSLAETGIVGFVFLLLIVGGGLVVTIRWVLRSEGAERGRAAAALAIVAAFAFEAGIDWIWEVPAVTVPAVAALALAAGRSGAGTATSRRGRAIVSRIAVAVLALVVVAAEALPALADQQLRASANYASTGDLATAYRHALVARSLEPWSIRPYQQLALVAEAAGGLRAAESWVGGAIRRDPNEWSSWLIKARIETKLRHVRKAAASLERARALDPRSQLFADLGHP